MISPTSRVRLSAANRLSISVAASEENGSSRHNNPSAKIVLMERKYLVITILFEKGYTGAPELSPKSAGFS